MLGPLNVCGRDQRDSFISASCLDNLLVAGCHLLSNYSAAAALHISPWFLPAQNKARQCLLWR